jgi:starch synthase
MLNGLDSTRYNPAFDRNLARNYDSDHIALRRENKRELQRHCGFDENPVTPLLGMVGRLTAEKGVDSLRQLFPSC